MVAPARVFHVLSCRKVWQAAVRARSTARGVAFLAASEEQPRARWVVALQRYRHTNPLCPTVTASEQTDTATGTVGNGGAC